MADLNIKITAQDKASPTIKAVGQQMASFGKGVGSVQQVLSSFATGTLPGATAALGNFSAGIGQLGGKLTSLIGTGGLGGLAVGLTAVAVNIDSVSDSIADWALGLSGLQAEFDKLNQKMEQHLKTVTAIRNQRGLVGLVGSERTAAEIQQIEEGLGKLQKRIDILRSRKAGLEAREAGRRAAEEAALGAIQRGGEVPFELVAPAARSLAGDIKDVTDEIVKLEEEARPLRESLAKVNTELAHEKSEEGKKRLKEHAELMDKIAEGNYKNMLQIHEAVAVEQKLFTEWSEDLLKIKKETADTQKAIESMGLERLQKSLGTGVTEEAIAGGLAKQDEMAKKIIKDRQDQLKDEQEIWLKLNQQREQAYERQREQYERMIDSIAEGAGRVFDAMLTKGQSVFSSLARFAEGILQTALRGVFQNAVSGLLTGGGGARGGGAGLQQSLGGAGGSIAGGLLGKVFGGGGGGARLQESIVSGGAAKGGGFLGSLFGGGAAGAGGLAAGLGTAAATAGVSMAVGLGLSFVSGLFNRGAQKRAEEQARRAGIIQGQQFAAPETISRFGVWGAPGEYAVETDLTGQIRGIGKEPQVNNVINVQMIDARHAREAGEVIGQAVSQQILAGGGLLSDNIQWAAS